MAAITSLGVRSPAALQYLISEGLLPADARPSSYTWQTDYRDEDELSGFGSEEELLQTETCVVWTQGGIVRKAFRFEVEEEKVSQAILTWFPTSESHNLDTTGAFSDGSSSEVRSESNGQRPQASGWSTKAQSYSTRFGTQTSGPSKSQSKIDNQISRARALVVILRTQAHIFFLSGTSHVVHLPFEVENVFPAPQGVLLQRKLFQSPFGKSGIQPTAPPNSFLSSQTFHSSPILTREPFPQNPSHGPAIPTGLLLELFPLSPPDDQGSLPCLFAMTDPLVEMGLVVTAPPFHQSLNLPKKRPSQASSNLSPEEKLLYMSPQAEAFNQEIGEGRPQSQLILALTSNAESNKYTVWSVEYLLPNSLHSGAKTRVPSGTLSRRRSSMGPGAGTGATTPTAYTNNSMMENMMGTTRGVGISQLPKTVTTQRQDDESIDPLVSSLDPEYDGVPAPEKQSRRVSSLLARADLSTNHDRKTFSDLATGHGTNYRGPSSTFRRGESLGSQTPRTSFGGSYNHNQRKSMPGNTFSMPRMSSGTYDPPVDELLEELNSGGDFEGFESMGLQEVVEGLKQEIIMRPLISIPLQAAAEENSKDATLAPKPKIFTITDPQIVSSSTRASKLITMCLFEQKRKKLSVLTFMVHSDLVGLDRSKKKVQSSTRPVAALSADLLELKHGSDVIDAAKIRDGDISRILVLTETKDRHGELTIQAPWSPPARISLPDVLSISNPYYLSLSDIPTKRREGSLKRVLSQAPKALLGLETGINGSCRGQVDVFDEVGRRHHLAVQMRPQSLHIRRIIDVCRYVLPGADRGGEGILVGWWAAKNWLQSKNQSEETEWTALTIILFSMALPFLPKKNVQPSGIHKTKKAGFLRSSSGASNDTESWHSMIESENHKGNSSPAWLQGSAWNWIVEEDVLSYHPPENPTISNESSNERQGFIAHCMSLTSEFLQSSEGNMAIGRRGYLPTAVDRNPEVKCTALATILIGLHLLREDQKLDIATSDLVGHGQLLPVLAQIGFWLGWRTWGWKSNSYYRMEDIQMCHWRFDDSKYCPSTKLCITDIRSRHNQRTLNSE
jgi:anaphase-promoting complex subunit 1